MPTGGPPSMVTWLRSRLDADPRTVVVALGDAIMIALFVSLGELRHGGTIGAGLETFGQFALAWLLVAVAAGAYAPGALDRPVEAALLGVGTWIVAALVAQLIRLLVTPSAAVQPVFVVVSIGVGGLFIGGWRVVAARTVAA